MPGTFLSPGDTRILNTEDSFQPGALIEMLLRQGLGAPPGSIRQESVRVQDDVDWTQLCATSHRCRIAPVIYQCLRGAALPVPPGVMVWFRAQYYQTVARNLALLNDLRELLGWVSEAAVPAIVLKGPALAHLGLGVARVSHDLDVLVRDRDLGHVDAILCRHGYRSWPERPHEFHRTYSRSAASGTRVLEIHFDVSDRPRPYKPDVAGIWGRSVVTTIFDVPARVPELSDHLLLTIMQLPHHHWAMRLVVDLWQVALRWGERIDWQAFLERAGAWHMSVLTKSTLHMLATMFDVPIAPEAMARAHPMGYFERVQWQLARRAIAEQLEHPYRPKVTMIAPFLLVDQVKGVPVILMKRSLGAGSVPEQSGVTKVAKRTAAAVAALPAIAKVFLAGISQSSLRGSRGEVGD